MQRLLAYLALATDFGLAKLAKVKTHAPYLFIFIALRAGVVEGMTAKTVRENVKFIEIFKKMLIPFFFLFTTVDICFILSGLISTIRSFQKCH